MKILVAGDRGAADMTRRLLKAYIPITYVE
jgi:hypothetical protein